MHGYMHDPGVAAAGPGRGLFNKIPKSNTLIFRYFVIWGNYRKNVALTHLSQLAVS